MRRLSSIEAERRRPPLAISDGLPRFSSASRAQGCAPRAFETSITSAPQFWAWRPLACESGAPRRFAAGFSVSFPFERKILCRCRCASEIHSATRWWEMFRATLTPWNYFCKKYGLAQGNAIITILPGSRRGREIAHHVSGSLVESASRKVRQKSLPRFPEICCCRCSGTGCLSAGSQIPLRLGRCAFSRMDTYNALAAAGLGHRVPVAPPLWKTALLDKPMIVVYRLSPLTGAPRETAGENEILQHGQPDLRAAPSSQN